MILTFEHAVMLDKAARAQGWVDYPTDSAEHGQFWHLDCARAPHGPRIAKQNWTPLEDNSQAFMLATHFRMNLTIGNASVVANGQSVEVFNGNVAEATRRAIVKAASLE